MVSFFCLIINSFENTSISFHRQLYQIELRSTIFCILRTFFRLTIILANKTSTTFCIMRTVLGASSTLLGKTNTTLTKISRLKVKTRCLSSKMVSKLHFCFSFL